MTESADPITDRERGNTSREGFANVDAPSDPQATGTRPRLTEPAEQSANLPSHSVRDDGLGERGANEDAAERPVPPGNPHTESDRSDVQ